MNGYEPMPEPILPYASQPARRLSRISVAAFVMACLPVVTFVGMTKPFWTGHALEAWQPLTRAVPPIFSIPAAFLLSAAAILRLRWSCGTRTVYALCIPALVVSGLFMIPWLIFGALLVTGQDILPVPS